MVLLYTRLILDVAHNRPFLAVNLINFYVIYQEWVVQIKVFDEGSLGSELCGCRNGSMGDE